MDLYINQDELTRALKRVQGVVDKRPANPLLSHVFIEARDGALHVVATDGMVTLTSSYPAQIEREGSMTVDAARFLAVATSLTGREPTVRLQLGKNLRLGVRCGKTEFNLTGTDGADYPPPAPRDDRARLQVTGGDLRRIIDETVFSICTDENRYGLNGAHLEQIDMAGAPSRLRMVTTDGSRLSWSEAAFEGSLALGRRMLLPRKALQEIKKLIDESEATWDVDFGDRTASFTAGDVSLRVRLVEGEFPDYRMVLPQSSKRRVVVDRDALMGALRRVVIMAGDRNNSIRCAFEEGRMVLSAQDSRMGEVREELVADLDGAPLQTGFNARYLQDILTATRSEQLQLDMGEALDPCILRIPGRDDCLFVVMPMRLD